MGEIRKIEQNYQGNVRMNHWAILHVCNKPYCSKKPRNHR